MIDIAGTTYYYMDGPLLVLMLLFPLLLIVLAVFNRLFFSKRFSFWKRFLATVALLLVAAVWMHWDVYQIGQEAKELCSKYGGLHVYNTAYAEGFKGSGDIKYWSEYGFKYVESEPRGKKTRYTMHDGMVVKEPIGEYRSKYESVYDSKIIDAHFKRHREFVRDRITHEVLGELVYFAIYPGWVDSQIWGRIGFTFTPWICGWEAGDDEQRRLRYYDVIKAVLKVKQSGEGVSTHVQ